MIVVLVLMLALFPSRSDGYEDFLRDLQKYFNSDWIVTLIPVDSNRISENRRLVKMRKTLFSYVSMYSMDDFLTLKHEELNVRNPVVLYWHQKGVDLFTQFKQLSDFESYFRFVWILITRHDVFNQMKSVYVPFNCLFIICQELPTLETITMIEIYKTSESSELFWNYFGVWNSSSGLNVTSSSFLERRMNFHKQVVKVNKGVDNTGGPFSRAPNYLPGIWKNVEERLNITSLYIDDKDFDVHVHTNTMNGPSGPSHEYIHTLFTFNNSVWILIIIWITVTSAVMGFTMKKTPKFKDKTLRSEFSWRVFDVLAILFQKGALYFTESHAIRIIATVQLYCSMMMFGIYSALFISFITVSEHKPPFSELTLEGVLRQGQYNILVVPEKSLPFFQMNQHPTVRALLERQLPPFEEQPKTFMEGFRKVCYSPGKYLTEYPTAAMDEIRLLLPDCKISRASILINRFQTTWLVKRGSPFKPMIQLSMLKMTQAGIVGTDLLWKKVFLRKKMERNLSESIEMAEVLQVFAALMAGAITAFMIFAAEIGFKKCKKLSFNNCRTKPFKTDILK